MSLWQMRAPLQSLRRDEADAAYGRDDDAIARSGDYGEKRNIAEKVVLGNTAKFKSDSIVLVENNAKIMDMPMHSVPLT